MDAVEAKIRGTQKQYHRTANVILDPFTNYAFTIVQRCISCYLFFFTVHCLGYFQLATVRLFVNKQ
jgi:hypothetical protein